MKLLKSLSRQDFREKFGTKAQCLSYLSDEKWAAFYSCIKCENNKYSKGKKSFNRRCSRCGYDESPTANTLFHKLKFGIDKAFEMSYDIATSKKGASSIWLAERHGVKQMTAWLFRRKVQQAMKISEKYPLEKEVHVDEFEIGWICYSSKSLNEIFDIHISTDEKVETEWNIHQIKSDKGNTFFEMNPIIHQVESWLRSTYSWMSDKYIEKYLNEYSYRLNRSIHKEAIFDNLMSRLVDSKTASYQYIKISI